MENLKVYHTPGGACEKPWSGYRAADQGQNPAPAFFLWRGEKGKIMTGLVIRTGWPGEGPGHEWPVVFYIITGAPSNSGNRAPVQ
jgi:hypothetical protein